VRSSGTDDDLKGLAERNALAIGAGHSFIVLLRNAYPLNVLNAIKLVPEVASIYCASANPVQVVLAESEQGRGILGVIDGIRTQGIEDAAGVAWRTDFLRKIGYKAG
jgi:adenosine/AMP kinase